MSSSYTHLLYHIIFSTKERQPILSAAYQARLYEYIGGTLRGLGGIPLGINGTENHVHLLAKLRPDNSVSDVLRDLKANAGGWMHDVFPTRRISRGNVATPHSRSVNPMYKPCKNTLRASKSIT